MPFESIRFHNFRNIQNAEIPIGQRQVFLIGENGQGKTNFLEAVYCLCYGKSFRTNADGLMVTHGQQDMLLQGRHHSILPGQRDSQVRLTVIQGKKEIKCDDKTLNDRKILIDRYPCVVFCHDDLDFVRGAPDQQRLFFDQTASLIYPEYLENLRDYNKTLKSRNVLLKEQRVDVLEAYNEQLLRFGFLLMQKRRELVKTFNILFTKVFEEVSGGISDVKISYQPNWQGLDYETARNRLHDRLITDLALKTTTSGVHRDKFLFLRGAHNFSDSASTGQFRLMSLLMRLAQASLIESICQRAPVLLLDDVLLELDFEKRKRFLAALPSHEQAFFTFLPDEQVSEYAGNNALLYVTEQGSFHEKSQ